MKLKEKIWSTPGSAKAPNEFQFIKQTKEQEESPKGIFISELAKVLEKPFHKLNQKKTKIKVVQKPKTPICFLGNQTQRRG